ncbi:MULTISPECIES: S8 family serine peptidase [Nostoc]|uniref:S8 family serine peptidase n=1 Tax=Nostoc paludosum FACHB-159 TaxID=2692908 RepID=A0ABR8K4T7_9NOSO|nr:MULTISPECIES: S8 family serine peptidase [Nostoc]MBD2677121.1 S8 family serine peptidase [Nostoc sp. FACHB-857]MBD2733320.1 S8 family serine peptidase [Nostoc paludosum FACHB-159]
MVTFPSDYLFSYQWHLYNPGGLDLNVVNVWDDYTGNGVIVGVIDDGFDYLHYDLDGNYDTTIDYDFNDNNFSAYGNSNDNHGTSVAGIIAAENNGLGSVGVAYNATVTGFRAISSTSIDGIIGGVTNALWNSVNVDVVNNSWGFGGLDSPYNRFYDNFNDYSFLSAKQAIVNAVANGRNGLGTAIVFSAGNDRQNGNNTNYHNFQNSRHVITVAALNSDGSASTYSTPGASILVSAFGSGISGSIVTTDRIGYDGYDSGDYNYSFNGTSAAAPMVSGVIALILEANPNLGYRDIQEILAYSARQNDPYAWGGDYIWQYNGANNWNGGGLHVSQDYGFGLIDAHAAVRLAETWHQQSRLDNEQSLSFSSGYLGWFIPDNDNAGISHTFTVSADLDIDTVEVELDLTHPYRGDLVVYLTSPNGTQSVLVQQPGNKEDDGDNIVFKFSSTQHWGENSGGNWTLTIKDLGPTDIGIFNSWKLNLYGDADTVNDTYFYTNEYGIYGATTLTDTSGIDTINAAAITSNSYLDLTPGSVSTLDGTFLTISAETVIENALGGDGDDIIIGNTAANFLSGGRGDDILVGGVGNDTLTGGTGYDLFTFYSPTEEIDAITDFNAFDDTICIYAPGFGGGLIAGGAIAVNQFALGTASTTNDTRFILNQDNGSLFFDADGTGAIAQTQIATLNTGLSLSNANIYVFA